MIVRFASIGLALGAVFLLFIVSSCATSHHDLAIERIDAKEHDAAVEHLELGAAEGDVRCDYLLASLILNEKLNGNRDLDEAVNRMSRAAEAGLPDAQADLGKLYESGRGVEQDLSKSADWYQLAAEAGQPEAQSNLGLMYEAGRGVEPDAARAAELYRQSAEKGYGPAQGALGLALFEGNGVAKDVVEGYRWTMLAAEQQDWTAMENLKTMKPQMTPVQRSIARQQASDFRVRDRPRRSRLNSIRSQAQNKDRGNRRRKIPRPSK